MTLDDKTKDELDGKTVCARCKHKIDEHGPRYWKCDTNIKTRKRSYVTGNIEVEYAFCEFVNTDGNCPDFEEVQSDE